MIKKHRHHFADKGLYGQSYGFASSYVCMWELDYKEGWALKNWYFQTVMLEETLESPLDNREIKPVNPKGSQFWTFSARTDAWSSNTLATWWEETLMLGNTESRRRGQERVRRLDGITDSVDMSLSKHWEIMKNWEAWHAAVHGGTKSWTWLNDWTRTLLTSSVLDIVNIICSN